MAYENIKEKFEAMGAQAVVSVGTQNMNGRRGVNRRVNYTVDVNEDRKQGDTFEVLVAPEAVADVEITIPNIDKALRHLLLAVRNGTDYNQFLCGHDERHWFVAALPHNVSNVHQAIEALKPDEAAASQNLRGVRLKNRNKRRNAGFIRQGEWFFVPVPELDKQENLIVLRNEPLQRGRRKPHMAQFLYRAGGINVYVSQQYPEGVTEKQYRNIIAKNPEVRAHFQLMTRNAKVFVKGKVAHPDHKTVALSTWHEVFTNNEEATPEMVFLD